MKILFSQIKHLIPELNATAREVGEVLTMVGMMMDSFESVTYQGNDDYLLGLETRNRVDCLSIWGVAREVSAYYGLTARIPQLDLPAGINKELNIKVEARSAVKRIKAVNIVNVENKVSPDWLLEFLKLYEINSINLLVDLSNYVMIMTGYSSHLLNQDKMSGNLDWRLNNKEQKINTLDGTEVLLTKGELVISDEKNILALAGLIGAKPAEIGIASKNIILEMAIYEHSLIKQNSRALSITTEAGNRLSKEMDPSSLESAFNYLVDLILTNVGGEIVSACDYYPAPKIISPIPFCPASASRFAGIEIDSARAMDILKSLRFRVEEAGDKWLVTPPADRTDIGLPEDLVEEVIRMVRYDTIPSFEMPALAVTPDVTKPIYYLKEKLRDILAVRGFDEVLSNPLSALESNHNANYLNWQPIITQNSVNEEFPSLRMSLSAGLLIQLDEFIKKNVEQIQIFEIGKVFGKVHKDYGEAEHLACLIYEPLSGYHFDKLQHEIEISLGQVGLNDLSFVLTDTAPQTANPHSTYIIKVGKIDVGIIYKARPMFDGQVYLAEINLEQVAKIVVESTVSPVAELNQKLIVLDANLELSSRQELAERLSEITTAIGTEKLWSLSVIDSYPLKDGFRFTVRAVYKDMDDKGAKSLHVKVFGL